MSDSLPSLWDYALALYSRPAVSRNCLRLQDERAWNVNLILACIWYGHFLGELTETQCRDIHAEATRWDTSVVSPLRQVRRWLKNHVPGMDKGQGNVEALRDAVKRLELAGERQQLQQIERQLLVNARPLKDAGKSVSAEPVRSNLALLGKIMDAEIDATEQDLLNTLLLEWEASYGNAPT